MAKIEKTHLEYKNHRCLRECFHAQKKPKLNVKETICLKNIGFHQEEAKAFADYY